MKSAVVAYGATQTAPNSGLCDGLFVVEGCSGVETGKQEGLTVVLGVEM